MERIVEDAARHILIAGTQIRATKGFAVGL
jgi:hypothetical protein